MNQAENQTYFGACDIVCEQANLRFQHDNSSIFEEWTQAFNQLEGENDE